MTASVSGDTWIIYFYSSHFATFWAFLWSTPAFLSSLRAEQCAGNLSNEDQPRCLRLITIQLVQNLFYLYSLKSHFLSIGAHHKVWHPLKWVIEWNVSNNQESYKKPKSETWNLAIGVAWASKSIWKYKEHQLGKCMPTGLNEICLQCRRRLYVHSSNANYCLEMKLFVIHFAKHNF